jgi:hypothetical protein
MEDSLTRFYTMSELFRDDLRLMAVAINEFTGTKKTKCSIYKDLLNCKHKKWIVKLEKISHLITADWLDYKEFMVDNGHDMVFLKGDIDMIEYMCCDTGDNDE